MDLLKRIDNFKFLPAPLYPNKFWHGQDTEEKYIENLKTQPQDWYYRKKKVIYNTNSDGYRTREFGDIDWGNSVVIFGCSYVFGVGHAEDDTISSQLEEILKIPVINMGVGGTSPTHAVHNASILSRGYPTPKGIINLWSSPFRCPYYTKDASINCGPWNTKDEISVSWNKTIIHPIVNLKFNSLISKEMWSHKTAYYELTQFPITREVLNCDFVGPVDVGRDLTHFGRLTNQLVAEKIAENLKI
jgi:hypothetical protein